MEGVYGNSKVSTPQASDVEVKSLTVGDLIMVYEPEAKCFGFSEIDELTVGAPIPYTEWVDAVPSIGRHTRVTRQHPAANKPVIGWSNLMGDYWVGLVTGTLMGDSYLSIESRYVSNNPSYRLGFQHTTAELAEFKANILGVEGKWRKVKTGYGSTAYRFMTHALTHTSLPLRKFYHSSQIGIQPSRKDIPYKRGLSSLMTSEGLSLWIADDGSIRFNNGNYKTPVLSISTHNHSDRQLQYFCEYFEKVWGCTPKFIRDKRVQCHENQSAKFLNFNTKDTLYILNHLKDKQVRGAEYKFYFPTEGYVGAASPTPTKVDIRVRGSRHMPKSSPYRVTTKKGVPVLNGNAIIT